MKRVFAIILLLLLFVGCGAKAPATETPEETNVTEEVNADAAVQEEAYPFGTFTAETLSGETVSDAIFAEADLTVVNLWATYCGPCKAEMPILGMLDRELDNVQVMGIVLDCNDQQGGVDADQTALAVDLMEAADADYTNLILNQDLAMLGVAYVESVPATLFVDGEGNLVGQGFYGALTEEGWRETIAQRLEMVKK